MDKPITRDELLELHRTLTEQGRRLMERKNQDYGANEDPFRNFRRHGRLGILVRMDDKMARLLTFVEKGEQGFQVADEGLEDTIVDIINYAVIFLGYAKVHDPSNDEIDDDVPF